MALTKPRAYQIFDLDYKQSVRVLTATNVTLSGGAPNIVDSVTLLANDRILVKGQSTTTQNGLYKVQTVGTGVNGTWVRTVDGDVTGEIQAGMIVMVTEGNTYKDTQWKLITNDPITIGISGLVFELNTSTSSISNGNSQIAISELGGNAIVTINNVNNVAEFTPNGLTTSSITTSGNALIGGNLIVNGNLTYVNVNDLNIEDPIIGLGRGPNNAPLTTNDGKDRGEQLWYYTTSEQSAFLGYDNSAGKLIAASNVSIANEIVTVNNYGTFVVGTLEGTTVSATGNITGDYVIGNGSQLTSLNGSNVVGSVGNSNYAVTTDVANVVSGNNQANITSVGTLVSLSVTGNVNSGNLVTVGNVSGNYILGNGSQLTGLAPIYNDSNVSTYLNGQITSNIIPNGNSTQSLGNATNQWKSLYVSNSTIYIASTPITVSNGTLQVNGANVLTGNAGAAFSTSGNISGGNISATGNIAGSYIIGNGSQLTGLAANYGNADVAGYLTIYTGNLSANVISATGNITGSYIIGNGSQLTGLPATYGNAEVSNYLASGTDTANIVTTGNINGGNINGTKVVATTLTGTLSTGAQTNISLVGTLSSLSVTGNVQGGNFNTIGAISASGNVVAGNVNTAGSISASGDITGRNLNSSNADLAEMYCADATYVPGTVVEFGGEYEITISTKSHSTRVAGIISTAPSYLMNSTLDCINSLELALVGRVPCRVVGVIHKGDRLVTSEIPGVATALDPLLYQPGCIVGKALESYDSPIDGIIEVAVGRA